MNALTGTHFISHNDHTLLSRKCVNLTAQSIDVTLKNMSCPLDYVDVALYVSFSPIIFQFFIHLYLMHFWMFCHRYGQKSFMKSALPEIEQWHQKFGAGNVFMDIAHHRIFKGIPLVSSRISTCTMSRTSVQVF